MNKASSLERTSIASVLKKAVSLIYGNRVTYFGSTKGPHSLNSNSRDGIGLCKARPIDLISETVVLIIPSQTDEIQIYQI